MSVDRVGCEISWEPKSIHSFKENVKSLVVTSNFSRANVYQLSWFGVSFS